MTERQLCHCNSGSTGIITKLEGESNALTRLQELGVLVGQWIRVIRSGNPTIFEIGDSRYCIRPKQLQGVSVQTITDRPETPLGHEERSTLSEKLVPIQSAHSKL